MMAKFIVSIALLLLLGAGCQKPSSKQTGANTAVDVTWKLEKDQTWTSSSSPPPCPDPLVLMPPADFSKVTAILYPGQPRGDAFKPHGGLRFSDTTPNNEVEIVIPFDAKIVQGSRGFRNGENQYSFVFVAPCGIMYSLGHLLELTPKFLAIINTLPLIDDDAEGFHVTQFYDVDPPVPVTAGEALATKAGYAIPHNVFFDFGVFDLRHPNGFTIRPEWAKQFANQFDHYAVCWLDLFTPSQSAYLRTLKGGDSVYGLKSDYCKT